MTYRRKKSTPTFPLLLLAMLVVGVGIWYVYFSGSMIPQGPQMGIPEVKVSTPLKQHLVEWDEYTGRFQAEARVEVRARVSGYLESVKFTDGQMVKKGDVLFIIDTRPYDIQLRRSKAKLELAEKQLERGRQLVTKSAVPRDEVDKRLQDFEEARSAVADAKLNLEFAEVRAPISGRVSRHLVSPGNLVTGGENNATLLTTIVSMDPIHLYFDASESDLLRYLRLDQEGKRKTAREIKHAVFARLMDEKAFSHQGHMDFVDNELDKSTGTIQGRAVFANSDLFLTPGMFARVRVPGSGEYEALLVPDDIIGTDQTHKFVLVVNAEGKAEPRPVTLGPLHRGLRIIREGLTAEDKVIISAIQRVRPGMPVKAVDAPITMSENSDMPQPEVKSAPPTEPVAAPVESPPPPPPLEQTPIPKADSAEQPSLIPDESTDSSQPKTP